ncbi:hypothetical protein [Blastomonas aquatica]|uniref:Uncharacterized protein n=1 Tax=Blastomonas aquatica TaxID=1510276 RepID=A0ABQ1JFA5_9SPHN|nr:hypothetical protein [Blastomonas aquatica]GGB67083.1 hypothetical protein GCM10010833_22870 [Blastomonas aquatica]
MVDNFAIAVSHLLVAIAIWRLAWRADLDHEDPPAGDGSGTDFFRRAPRPTKKGDHDA